MRRCRQCSGFVPARASRCPNCDVTASPRSSRRFWTPLAMLGVGAFSVTACAAYGAPCVALADGGTNCPPLYPCEGVLPDGGRYGDDPANAAECNPDGGETDGGATDGG